MEIPQKVVISLILAIIGIVVLMFGTMPPMDIWSYAQIGVGAALVVVYCILSWEWFSDNYGKDASIMMLGIPLLVFGGVTTYMGLTGVWMPPPHNMVVLGTGIALVLGSVLIMFKMARSSGEDYI